VNQAVGLKPALESDDRPLLAPRFDLVLAAIELRIEH
jgi:hypothetical protein